MKQLTFLNEIIVLIFFSTSILIFASCGYNQNSDDTRNVAEERNEAKFDNNNQQRDAQFLVNASEYNLKQIQLGQLAQQKGRSTEVKELGKRMEDAHTQSQRDLTALARSKTISIPTSQTNDSRDAYNKLNEKSGNDFDEEYANMMVSRHKGAISTFEKASKDSHDRDIQNWATSKLHDMRTHLDHSLDFQKKFADMYFERNN